MGSLPLVRISRQVCLPHVRGEGLTWGHCHWFGFQDWCAYHTCGVKLDHGVFAVGPDFETGVCGVKLDHGVFAVGPDFKTGVLTTRAG